MQGWGLFWRSNCFYSLTLCQSDHGEFLGISAASVQQSTVKKLYSMAWLPSISETKFRNPKPCTGGYVIKQIVVEPAPDFHSSQEGSYFPVEDDRILLAEDSGATTIR